MKLHKYLELDREISSAIPILISGLGLFILLLSTVACQCSVKGNAPKLYIVSTFTILLVVQVHKVTHIGNECCRSLYHKREYFSSLLFRLFCGSLKVHMWVYSGVSGLFRAHVWTTQAELVPKITTVTAILCSRMYHVFLNYGSHPYKRELSKKMLNLLFNVQTGCMRKNLHYFKMLHFWKFSYFAEKKCPPKHSLGTKLDGSRWTTRVSQRTLYHVWIYIPKSKACRRQWLRDCCPYPHDVPRDPLLTGWKGTKLLSGLMDIQFLSWLEKYLLSASTNIAFSPQELPCYNRAFPVPFFM